MGNRPGVPSTRNSGSSSTIRLKDSNEVVDISDSEYQKQPEKTWEEWWGPGSVRLGGKSKKSKKSRKTRKSRKTIKSRKSRK
jgi:hypothetical protein